MIMDGHLVHKSKKRDFVAPFPGRLAIYLLPHYAPDLSPDVGMFLSAHSNPHLRTEVKIEAIFCNYTKYC